ncbi:MAG: DUF4264 family protein [Bacillota bacterium]
MPDERPRIPRLPLLAELPLPGPDLVRLVTFLNQTLKEYGFVFGLSRDGEGYRLSVYRVPGSPNLPGPEAGDHQPGPGQ